MADRLNKQDVRWMQRLLLPYTIDLSLFSELVYADLIEHIERVAMVFYEKTTAKVRQVP